LIGEHLHVVVKLQWFVHHMWYYINPLLHAVVALLLTFTTSLVHMDFISKAVLYIYTHSFISPL